jgi:hypothetical protein
MAVPHKKNEERAQHAKALQMQQIKDIERTISSHVGTFIVLIDEGTKQLTEKARLEAKSHFHKHGPEMKQLAFVVGGKLPAMVAGYLEAVEAILLSNGAALDTATVKDFYLVSEQLEEALNRHA